MIWGANKIPVVKVHFVKIEVYFVVLTNCIASFLLLRSLYQQKALPVNAISYKTNEFVQISLDPYNLVSRFC